MIAPSVETAWWDKETVALAVPVVFLVLPVTVLFAVYPGLAVLTVDL